MKGWNGPTKLSQPDVESSQAAPIVAVVQPPKSSVRHDRTGNRGGSSASRRLLRKAKVRAVFVIMADVLRQQPFEVVFIERDHVIRQVAAAASRPALRDAIGMSVQVRRMATLRFDVSE